MKEHKLSLKWLPWALVPPFFSALTLFVLFPLLSLTPRGVALALGLGETNVIHLVIAVWEAVAVAVLLYLLGRHNVPLSAIGVRGRLSLKGVALAILILIVGMGLYPAAEALTGVFGLSMYWTRRGLGHLTAPGPLIISSVLCVIFFPVVEETIYRGYTLNVFLERMGKSFTPMLVNALIFGGFHLIGGPGLMLYIFLATFLMVLLYYKFESIYVCIFAHSLNNLLGHILIPLLEAMGWFARL